MFLDTLGSGFSFVSTPDNLPTKAADHGKILTAAINTFINEASIGKSTQIFLLGEGIFLRSIPGLDDIDPLSGIFHVGGWPDMYALGKYYGVAGVEMKLLTNT